MISHDLYLREGISWQENINSLRVSKSMRQQRSASTKPLLEPMLTSHQKCSVTFTAKNFTSTHELNLQHVFEDCPTKITTTSPKGQILNKNKLLIPWITHGCLDFLNKIFYIVIGNSLWYEIWGLALHISTMMQTMACCWMGRTPHE